MLRCYCGKYPGKFRSECGCGYDERHDGVCVSVCRVLTLERSDPD